MFPGGMKYQVWGPHVGMEVENLAVDRNGAALLGRGLGQDKEETSFFWGVWVIPGGPWKKGRCREDKALLWDQTLHLQILSDLRKRGERRKEERGG